MSDKQVFNIYGGEYNPKGYGVGGIGGIKHDVVGWRNTTVGLAASVYNNVLNMNGVSSNDPNAIPNLEPLRAGRFLVKWVKYPPFFDPDLLGYIQLFFERGVRGISGIPDNSLSTVSGAPLGPTQRETDYPGMYKQSGKNFTLTTFTCTGDGLGKVIKYWYGALSDKETGVAHMYGKPLRFVRPNYSGSLLYVFLGPTGRPKDIEFACMWHECFPVSSEGDGKFNNPQIGEVGSLTEQEVEFSGIYDDSPIVDVLAQYVVAAAGLYGQSQFDQVLPAYLYNLFLGQETTDDELRSAMNLNLRDQIDKTVTNSAKSFTSYTADVIKRHDDLSEQKGIGNNAIRNAVTFEKQMEAARTPFTNETVL